MHFFLHDWIVSMLLLLLQLNYKISFSNPIKPALIDPFGNWKSQANQVLVGHNVSGVII